MLATLDAKRKLQAIKQRVDTALVVSSPATCSARGCWGAPHC